MKAASTTLKNLLYGANSVNALLFADLFTFTLADGTVLRYTSFDTDLTVSGNTFKANDVLISKKSVRTVLGVEVSDLTITAHATASNTVTLSGGQSLPFITAVTNGLFDGGFVTREVLCMSSTPGDTSAGTVKSFSGRISDITYARDRIDFTVKSYSELFDTSYPRNLYQAACRLSLYDVDCTVSRTAFKASSSVSVVTDKSTITCATFTSNNNAYYSLGKIVFSSGVNNGTVRSIKTYTWNNSSTQVFVLSYPLLNLPGVSDTFDVYPGCDKTMAVCNSKFNNLSNYRGIPFIPVPEASY